LPSFDEWKGITSGGDWGFHEGASVREDVNGVNGFFMAKGVDGVLVANTTPTIESHVFVPFLNASAETPVADREPTGYAAGSGAFPGFRITPWDNGVDPWKFWAGADNESVGATYGYRVRCVQEDVAPGVNEIAHGGAIWADRNLKAPGEWADDPTDLGYNFVDEKKEPNFDNSTFCPAGWHLPTRAEFEAAIAGQSDYIFDTGGLATATTAYLKDAGGHELPLPLCTPALCGGDVGGLYIGNGPNGDTNNGSFLGWGYFGWWGWGDHISDNDNRWQGWKTFVRCVKD
jgi:hypothetical protein